MRRCRTRTVPTESRRLLDAELRRVVARRAVVDAEIERLQKMMTAEKH
jgi:hypothetical protein